jgi:hypothetical protein
MSVSDNQAYQLTKAQISKQRDLMKSDAAKKYIRKKQIERGGTGQGYYQTVGTTSDGRPPGTVVKADGKIRTVQDMIDYYYGFMPAYAAKQNGGGGVAKANDPVVGGGGASPTPGYRNAVFGSEVFSTLNHEANAFALIDSRAWTKSGERTITDFSEALGSGGSGENSEIRDTNNPEIDQFTQTAKTIQHSFDVSQVKQLLSETEDDDIEDPFGFLRRYFGEGTQHQNGMGEHPKHMNVQMLEKIDDISQPAKDREDLLSLDQIISNQQEVDIGGITSGAANVYDFDRSAGEFEATVVHNNGDPRTFTTDILDDMITGVKTGSGKDPVADDNYFFLTNHDTAQRIEEEVGGKERLDSVRASMGLNGVETTPGDDVGITVSAYKDIPLMESVDVPQDEIGRVYLIDSQSVYMKTLLPTQFYSSGTEVNDDPYSIDRLGNQGLYVTIGEVVTADPSSLAKARDLA